jgi:hypothetical protein
VAGNSGFERMFLSLCRLLASSRRFRSVETGFEGFLASFNCLRVSSRSRSRDSICNCFSR